MSESKAVSNVHAFAPCHPGDLIRIHYTEGDQYGCLAMGEDDAVQLAKELNAMMALKYREASRPRPLNAMVDDEGTL